MRKFAIYLLLGLLAVLVILYMLAWGDLIGNNQLSGNLLKDIGKSFTYFIGWLPYWWLMIVIGTVALAFLFYGIKLGIGRLRE